MESCKHADTYQAIRKPTCGCQTCRDKYVRARLQKIMHGDFYGDPLKIQQEAANALDVLG